VNVARAVVITYDVERPPPSILVRAIHW
jgi:hypothetical protein